MKPLFIKQLENIKETMDKSAQEALYMDAWVSSDIKPACGYAACVLGDHAMHGDLSFFNNCRSKYPSESASLISCALDESCGDLTGSFYLSDSIYRGYTDIRYEAAHDSGLFTQEELNSFDHLTEKNPTPADAAEYIQAIIEKLS